MQYQYYSPYRGYLSTVEPLLHFGIDPQPVDSIRIQWPDGTVEMQRELPPGHITQFTYTAVAASPSPSLYPLLPTSQLFDRYGQLSCLHVEDAYVDFKLQPLLPKHYAHEGPGLAVGDINGDGQEDLIVGSSADHSPFLFVQQGPGFIKKDLQIGRAHV